MSRRRRSPATALLLAAAFCSSAAAAPPEAALVRGPYLQSGSQSEVVVRWRTDRPAGARVLYGLSPAQLDRSSTSGDESTEARVVLTGLEPETTYYYAIGTAISLLAGGDDSHRFRTPPALDSGRPVRLWALGDAGTGDAAAASVRSGFQVWNGKRPVDGLLLLGDNAYWSGTDAEYQTALFAAAADELRRYYLWPAFGNHDAYSSDSASEGGAYYMAFDLPREGEAGGRPSGTEAYYSFDVGDVHVIVLDSADSDSSSTGVMAAWLTLDLAANLRSWTVAVLHHPPYSFGSHDSDDPGDSDGILFAVREQLLPILEGAGVDFVLTGHSHGYERSAMIDGHYGTSDTWQAAMTLDPGDGDPSADGPYRKQAGAHSGTVYVVSGSAGSAVPEMEIHPVMVRSLPTLGSFALEFSGGRADGYFVLPDGSIADHFVIDRSGGLFSDGFENGTAGCWSESSS